MDKNRNILRESINKAVRSALLEARQKEKRLDTIVENVVSKKLRTLKEDDSIANKRNIVNTWLHDPKVNKAEVRRELEGEPETQKEEDAKRSYFIQRLNQTNGKEFSDEDIAELYAIKNNSGQ
jgi:hypothetical protein